jgi:hypothetical protein
MKLNLQIIIGLSILIPVIVAIIVYYAVYRKVYTAWNDAGVPCPVKCGGGVIHMTRNCLSGNCKDDELVKDEPCNTQKCCEYGEYSPWSECKQLKKTRQRQVINSNGNFCTDTQEIQGCNTF